MSTNASHLTVVTPNFVPKIPQVTKYIVINAGLTYVRDHQVITLQQVCQLFKDCYWPQQEDQNLRCHVTPYNPKVRAALKNKQPLPVNIPVHVI